MRAARNMRVSELARQIGVSSSLISQIERGHSRPSVATLFALARALDVPVDTFFADPVNDQGMSAVGLDLTGVNGVADEEPAAIPGAALGPSGSGTAEQSASPPPEFAANSATRSVSRDPHVVLRHQRAAIDIRGGVRWERLTPTALDGVEFLELVYAPGAESDPQAYRHPGIELVVVTQGVMKIFLGFEQHDLQPGDSIAFPSSTPHRYVNPTDTEARAVTVILRDDLSTLPLRDDSSSEQADSDAAREHTQ